MGLALLVWVGGGLLKRVLYFFGNEPSLGRKSPILHPTRLLQGCFCHHQWLLLDSNPGPVGYHGLWVTRSCGLP